MAFIHSLCSSSKGNSTYIGTKQSGVIVDCGIGIRNFTATLAEKDIELSAIKGIFITHEHSDHISGLQNILKKINVPIYASAETLDELLKKNMFFANTDLNEIKKKTVTIADMQVSAFSTPHDSANSLGFCIKTSDDKKICLCTDLGNVTDEVYSSICGCDLILLESNYDEIMLTHGDYPYFLKHRIASKDGHLSNTDCSKTLIKLLNDGTKKFVLGHLSQNNNRPELALQSALNELGDVGAKRGNDYILSVAPVRSIGELIDA